MKINLKIIIWCLVSRVKLSKICLIIGFQNVWCTIPNMLFNNQHTCLVTNQCSLTRWMKMDGLKISSKLWMKTLPHEWKQKNKNKNRKNDVAGLDWCWTWPPIELVHKTSKPRKISNLQVQKNQKKKKQKLKGGPKTMWINFIGPLYPKALSSLPNVPKGPYLGGFEKCSKAHNDGNGILSSSHSWHPLLTPFFFFLLLFSSPIAFFFFSFLFFLLYYSYCHPNKKTPTTGSSFPCHSSATLVLSNGHDNQGDNDNDLWGC